MVAVCFQRVPWLDNPTLLKKVSIQDTQTGSARYVKSSIKHISQTLHGTAIGLPISWACFGGQWGGSPDWQSHFSRVWV